MTSATAPDSTDNETDVIAVVRQPALALALILATKPELFINVVGQPTIGLPSSPERLQQKTWPLRSERVKAWIAEFIWHQSGIVLAEREIDRIVTVLVGKAWHDPRHDIELTDAMDQDPLLEALLILMHEHAIFDKTCTALHTALDQVAREAGLDTKDRLWPKGAPQLSRRIEELKPLLKRGQVTAVLGRRSGGFRFVKLTRDPPSGGDAAGPPLPPPVDNSHHPAKIHRHDDGDDVFRKKLFDQLRPPHQETKNDRH
jgi:hypothetical protein